MKNLNKMKIAPDMQYEIGQDKVGYFPEWSVKDDETLWQKVNKLAHSTFDRSKFTVVGSPNITDDGIASAFSIGNYIKSYVNIPLNSKWKITLPINIGSERQSHSQIMVQIENASTSHVKMQIELNSSGYLYFWVRHLVDGSTTNIISWNKRVALNTNNLYSLEFTGTHYNIYENGIVIKSIESNIAIDSDSLVIFSYANEAGNYSAQYPQDLKQFSVTVDGVEIFSGNKTGIDIIKPDNYTVVGSPTVSADGIATFSTGNYITISDYLSGASSFVLKCRGTLPPSGDYNVNILGRNLSVTSGYSNIFLGRGNTTTLIYFDVIVDINGTATSLMSDAHSEDFAGLDNEPYDLTVSFDGTKYQAVFNFDNGTTKTITITSSYKLYNTGDLIIGFMRSGEETIDLNSFKIYVEGSLVYQPCLKIPYTEGQNYVKVVDKLYRDRVKDLFEQKGYNIYYTLGEDDFTLPSNKPNDIVKYKANGLTVAEQRADQTLTIRGACEQGVDVNLPMEFFSDDSYAVFGVGTTGTNTASKFTPAADGNYIAIGKGKV